MSDPFRKLSEVERRMNQANNAARQPQRQMRQAQNKARNIARAPGRQARQFSNQARQLQNLPGQQARRAKNAVGRPMRQLQGTAGQFGIGGRGGAGAAATGHRYKRKADRMSGTDLSISAMVYPMAWMMTPIAGFIADWDTAFIKYHVAHARWVGIIGFLFLPIIAATLFIDPVIAIAPIVLLMLVWFYTWYLGFKAYGGQLVIIPFLTNWLIKRNVVDIVTIQSIMGGAKPEEVRVHYNPNARR